MEVERNLVIVGGGIAATTAAEAARAEYPDARITLIGAEARPFYNRISLGAVVTGAKRPADLRVRPAGWLEDQRIEVRSGSVVEALDLPSRTVFMAGGEAVRFDALILATGAAPTKPPFECEGPGPLSLWTMDDATRLADAVFGARRITVVGGGVLGVELAADLAGIGKRVTVIEAADRLLLQQLDRPAADFFRDLLAKTGIDVRLGTTVAGVVSDGPGARVRLSDGSTLDTDLVVSAIGATPQTELAARAGLEVNGGIRVDLAMRTSDPAVLACGNCARPPVLTPLLWNPAEAQGRIAGINAFSTKLTWASAPAGVHLKIPEIPAFACAVERAVEPAWRVLEHTEARRHLSVVLDERGAVVKAAMIGDTTGAHLLERAIATGEPLPDTLAAGPDPRAVLDHLRRRPGRERTREGWVCRMCGFTHEGGDPPGICPVCGVGKDQFQAA